MGWLAGKTALVTGGARRLGRAVCLALPESGSNVVVHHSRSVREAEALAAEIDYRAIKKEIMAAAEGSRYKLVEALAERVAALCLGHPGVRRVDVVAEKPGSLRFARSAAVEITREPPA